MSRRGLIRLALIVAAVAMVVGLGLYRLRTSIARELREWKARMAARGEKFAISDLAYGSNSVGALPTEWLETRNLLSGPSCVATLLLMKLEAPGIAQVAWDTNTYREASRVDWVSAISEVDRHSNQLAAIRHAVQSPPDHCGWPYANYSTFPAKSLMEIRKVTQWLSTAAIVEMHQNRPAAAIDSLVALLRLAQGYREERYFVLQMIRAAVLRFGASVTWELLQFNGWTEADLAMVQQELEQIELSRSLEWALEMERAIVLSYIERARNRDAEASDVVNPANSRSAGDFYTPIWNLALSRRDELLYLRRMQHILDAMRSAAPRRSAAAFRAQMDAGREATGSFIGQTLKRLTHPVSHVGMANYEKALGRWFEAETERQMAIAAVALKRYHLKHGKYPARFQDLVPVFIAEAPIDYMDGKPLRYQPDSSGFLLYSVGNDDRDDGGDATSTNTNSAISLWGTRDVIWPKALNATGD